MAMRRVRHTETTQDPGTSTIPLSSAGGELEAAKTDYGNKHSKRNETIFSAYYHVLNSWKL